MVELMRPLDETILGGVVDEVACGEGAVLKPAEQICIKRDHAGDVGAAVPRVASLAADEYLGLQCVCGNLAMATNAELQRTCEEYRVGADELKRGRSKGVQPYIRRWQALWATSGRRVLLGEVLAKPDPDGSGDPDPPALLSHERLQAYWAEHFAHKPVDLRLVEPNHVS